MPPLHSGLLNLDACFAPNDPKSILRLPSWLTARSGLTLTGRTIGEALLLLAASLDALPMLVYLRDKGADVNLDWGGGLSLMHIAAIKPC